MLTAGVPYRSAEVGKSWQTTVPRRWVKIWTQDTAVMVSWRDPKTYEPSKQNRKQSEFLGWVKHNVDYGVAARRVDEDQRLERLFKCT